MPVSARNLIRAEFLGLVLDEQGNVLLIETRIEASGDMPARDFKRVYTRMAS